VVDLRAISDFAGFVRANLESFAPEANGSALGQLFVPEALPVLNFNVLENVSFGNAEVTRFHVIFTSRTIGAIPVQSNGFVAALTLPAHLLYVNHNFHVNATIIAKGSFGIRGTWRLRADVVVDENGVTTIVNATTVYVSKNPMTLDAVFTLSSISLPPPPFAIEGTGLRFTLTGDSRGIVDWFIDMDVVLNEFL